MTKLVSLAVFVALVAALCLGDGSAQPKFVQLSPKYYVSTEPVSILFI